MPPAPAGPNTTPAPAEGPAAAGGKGARRVYSVAEVENMLDDNPRGLLNTTVAVRAQVVGGVSGDECSDFIMLADPENVSTYQKLFDPTASNAEFEHARAVPIMLAGPTHSFSIEILQMNTGIFTGHFVTCDRALRFRIERAVPLDAATKN